MAPPNVTLLMLTRGRPQLAIAAVESAISNTDFPLQIFVASDDDLESGQRIANALRGQARVFALQPRHYYCRGFNACMIWARQSAPVDLFITTNDDVTFTTNWAERAVEALFERFPDGMGVLELVGDELCAHYMSRAAFVDEHFDGLLCEPAYTCYCSDTEMRERAKALGRYSYFGSPLIQHYIKQDETRSEIEYWYAWDREQYKRRWQPGWHREVWQ